jgi:hypothetical protein
MSTTLFTPQDIHWVGSTNELNASYAADVSSLLECVSNTWSLICMLKSFDRLEQGYARVKHSLGVVVSEYRTVEYSQEVSIYTDIFPTLFHFASHVRCRRTLGLERYRRRHV